jgi:hypothetical protein
MTNHTHTAHDGGLTGIHHVGLDLPAATLPDGTTGYTPKRKEL